MPTIRNAQSLAAGGTFTPFAGNQYEYLPFNARVQIAIIAAATGLLATVFSGSDVLMQNSPVSNKGAAGVVTNPDDFLLEDIAMAGDRLNVTITNPTAGAVLTEAVAIITPL